jgi:glycosyltransferase involved in cell wall biosynthesis
LNLFASDVIGFMEGTRIPILYLAPWVDLGGSDKGTIDWFRHIDRERWAPSLITTQPSSNRWLHQIEPFAEEIWDLPDLMPGCSFPEFILGFIESRGVRLVHIMNSRLGFDLLPDIACLREPPVVVAQFHAEEPDRSGYVRYAARRYGNLIDAFSVTSEHLKRAVADYDIPPSRIEVIYSGVDGSEEFNPERVEPLPLNGNGLPRILWPGRVVEQKDPMLTLEVLARTRARGVEVMLDVVGDGHLASAARARAKELDVDDIVEWHPPSQEMARWYRGAELTLMTSTFEGVPYVIYESLAMGVPVVAPALPGNLEFMDEHSGALIEPREDAELYAEAITALLEDDKQRRKMGQRSRQRILSKFSLAEMGRGHDALYEQLLATRPASSRWRGEELFGGEDAGFDRAGATPPQPLRLPRDPPPDRSIGIIVPCYRHGIFLEECIGSIKAQTLAPTQVVVVDDGSEDLETLEALERLERDPELKVLRQAVNAGPSAARNRALAELETSYVLPLDADDQLLPGALEQMVAQLEAAPEDVGFIYPHAQHFGNRCDYVELPAYNLWLLMEENYCPAPALFDRRIFEGTGISYPQDIVVGHEDWDLILQLAEHGVHGQHANGPTFRYRRQGFSRINAVNYGPHSFQEAIERRHPSLYLNRDEIKAEWAPAVSIVLLDGGDEAWSPADLMRLPPQTCRDFELLAREGLAAGVSAVGAAEASGETWLQTALGRARGRWVCLLTPAAASSLRDRSFVAQILYAFWANGPVSAVVLADMPEVTRHTFAQLDDEERLLAQPVGVTFERAPEVTLPKVDLKRGDSALVELVLGLQASGPVQWRVAHGSDGRAGREQRPADGEPAAPAPRGALDINYGPACGAPQAKALRALSWQAPRLPELTLGTVRRWEDSAGWTPPETQSLCRHVGLGGEGRVITNDRNPPPGYALEFDLGLVRLFGTPGTLRLVATGEGFELSESQGELSGGRCGLGYVEEAPLPMLEPLELRQMPEGGELVLTGGAGDPLLASAEAVKTLGWIEPFPIPPRGELLHTGPWGLVRLRRRVDLETWRHRCLTEAGEEECSEVVLGSLHRYPGEGLVALRLRDDGRLATDLAQPGRASRDPKKIGAWIAAPLSWNGDGPAGGTRGLTRARILHLGRRFRDRRLTQDGGVTLGWLRQQDAPGCSPLISSTHPITGDQFVTCSAEEAVAFGFLPDGILGFIFDTGAERTVKASPIIPWAHAPGQSRRSETAR